MTGVSVSVRWLRAVLSTQDVIHALAAEGAPAGTAVAALEQTAGRGSRRTDWASPVGGLWLSILLRPESALAMELLSLRAGLAIIRVLERFGGRSLMLKWPNDIIAGGKKAGGILCEARWSGDHPAWVAVGVGLNVRNPLPVELAATSARLVDHGIAASPEELGSPVAEAVLESSAASGTLSVAEREAIRARDWLLGRALASPAEGVADGVLADGALRVRRADGHAHLLHTGPVLLAPSITLAE